MNDIDWSKAPEGAEAGYLGTSHAYDAWYKRDANGEVWQICPAAGFNDWVNMGGRKDFPVGAVLRPVAPAWVGIGLPPVGLECETLWSSTTGEYVPVRIIAHDEDRAVVRFIGGERKGEYDSDRQHNDYCYPIFRPIKTAEQLAAEALRTKYMPQLIKLWDADTERTEFLEAVYGLIVEASKS